MDIRFVTAGSGDVVAVMATDGGDLLAACKARDSAPGGRIAKATKAANFKSGAGQSLISGRPTAWATGYGARPLNRVIQNRYEE